MTTGLLSHLKVLDLTHHVAGPYCTKLLAGFGAEVIKVERIGTGDPLRQRGPFVHHQPGLERSIPFHWLNSGKQSITLNLKSCRALEVLRPLMAEADLLIENFSPRVMPSLGLDYGTVRQINPRIVMTSISNFGQTGPYRDYRAHEIVMYAMSGGMSLTGDRDRPPLKSGPAITQYTAGMHAYIGSLLALYRRGSTSEGSYVEISIQESALENIELKLVEALHLQRISKRNGDQHPVVPWECYPAQDGYAAIIGGPIRNWLKAVSLFEEPQLEAEPFRHVFGRIRQRPETEALLKPWVARHSKRDIFYQGQARGLAFGYLATMAEAFHSKQYQARQFFQPTDPHPEVGVLPACSAPFRPSQQAWRMGRAPLLGEHNTTIYQDRLGYSTTAMDQLHQEGVI
jgi:crotonobetainyl-CoA:carnitine CoA-transferase CaiB-like acyl-CoA transferase